MSGPYENGDIVDVRSQGGKWLGAGFINDHSKIRVRLLSRNPNDRYDDAFFARRVRYAVDYRSQIMGGEFAACRLVFGEADGLPGLTVDRVENVLVTAGPLAAGWPVCQARRIASRRTGSLYISNPSATWRRGV